MDNQYHKPHEDNPLFTLTCQAVQYQGRRHYRTYLACTWEYKSDAVSQSRVTQTSPQNPTEFSPPSLTHQYNYMAVEVKNESLTGLELILQSRALFADLMLKFRECHDLCKESKLFTPEVMLEIDTCAVTFRKMCLDTVTVARLISDQWLDSTIMFFENITKMDKEGLKSMLQTLGGQAKEIGTLFKVIAAWARHLAGKFHEIQQDTIKEAEEFKDKFAEAKQAAEKVRDQVKKQRDKMKKTYENAESVESGWKTAQVWLSWNPIGAIVTAFGTSAASKSAKKAKELDDEANRKLNAAMKEFRRRERQSDKAKVRH